MSTRKAFRLAATPATPARKRAALMVSAAAVALLTIPASAALAQPELPAAAIPSTTGPFVLPPAPTTGPAVSPTPTPTAPTGPAPSVLPQDPNVVAGRAGFATTGSNLDVNQSTDRVVIDWRSFDIGSEAAVNFHQPNSSSIAVNRVSGGGMPSQIWGTLTANGVVVILNPNGVLFSASSRVDVGGLVASTGQMNVDRFMAGDQRLEFTGATSGAIVTAGQINIAGAGLGAFVAPSVRNDGIINARFGRVALAAGETFTLDLAGDRLIELGLGANTPLVENYGSIIADGGRVQLSALAAGVVVDQVINAGGHISVSSAHQDGGTIVLEGDSVTVSGTLDASGATGGGNILALADHLTVTADARLTAAATVAGDGGFIETSGYETVNIADGATVNAAGAGGAAGTWLIDPLNLTIISGADNGAVTGSTVTAGTIEATLGAGTNVSLTTNQTGGEDGDLTVAGSVNATALGGASLILTGRHIVATGGSTISINGGDLTMNVNAVNTLADTTASGNWIQDALNVIGTVSGDVAINLGAGTYRAGSLISHDRVTLDGQGVARIDASHHGDDGVTVTGDYVTVQNLEIFGDADQNYITFTWPTTTRGVVLRNGAENATVTGNNIHDVRNGVLVDGRNNGSAVTDNMIENTKGAVSVQYTDGSNIILTGNREGVFGNEWGINVHLNGILQANGSITPSAGALGANTTLAEQARLLAMSDANNGMSIQNQAWTASNRTHAYVSTTGGASNQGSARSTINTVQGGVNAVVNGGTVYVADGTYNWGSSALLITKSLTLTGQSEAGTIFDGRGVGSGLGTMQVQADNVTLSNFTLYGADSGANNYGIKVQPIAAGYNVNQRLHNFAISDVTVRGSTRAELDLNGVVGATITNFTADGRRVSDDNYLSGGAGVQITDSSDITLTGVHTLGNAWGGVALYQSNKAGAYNGQTTDINIDAGANQFEESLGLFSQLESTTQTFGQLNLTGFNFAVRNTGHRTDGSQFTFFRTSLADATAFALGIGAPATSSIEGYSGTDFTNVFTVVDGLAIGSAVRDARTGGTINVGAGTFNEMLSLSRGVTLSGAGMDSTYITGGISLSNTAFSDLTLQGFTLSGNGGSNSLVRNGRVTNLTVDGVRFDGETVAGRYGFAGGQFGGAISITNSEFVNIRGWSAFDTSTGGTATPITSVVFSNNLLDNTVGHVTFRQATPTANVLISNNTVRNVGDTTVLSSGIFKVFGAATVDFIGNNISGIGASPTKFTAGVNDGAALIVTNVGTLNLTDNVFTDNQQALLVGSGNALPAVMNITGNTFDNNAYDIFLPASAGGTVTFGAGNAFISGAATQQHIVRVAAGDMDLTNVLFDGKLGSAMSNAELFALEDRITHGTDVAGAGLALVKADNVYVTTASGSIQRGINVASTGYTVNLDGGTFTLPSTLNVNKAIALVGAGRNATVINAAATGYGISVSAGGVELADFTLNGPSADAGSSYGIKVSPGGPRTSVLDGFTINNVTVRGSGRAELDLNGVRNAVIDGFIADGQGTKGAGIQVTDSDSVVIRNSTTFDNAWGGVALYLANRSYDQKLANITIEASNDFQEVNSLFFQGESTLYDAPGALTIEGYSHIVQNDTYRASEGDWIYFQKTLQDALDFAVNLSALDVDSSVVGGWSGTDFDGTFTVGMGNLISGGTQALSIGAAAKAAEDGNTVRVLAGIYNGFGTSFGGAANVSILGDAGAIIDGAGVTGRIVDLRADGTIFSGFTIVGDGTGVGVSVSGQGVTVSDNTITDVLTGVQTTTQYAAGNAVISGNTISADYGVSLQNTGNTVSGNTVNAAIEGVGLAQGANSFSDNTFTIGAGGDALNLYLTASAADMTGANNTVTIAGGGLQGAVDLALDDGTVNVGDGTYAEDVLVSGVRTLQFGEVTVDGLTLAAGAAGSGISGDVTSTGDLAFVGDVTLLGNLSLAAAGSTDLAGVTGAGHSLSLAGTSVSLGSADDLDALDITGATTLNGGSYAANDVTVTGATTLTRDTTIAGSTITLGSISGAHSLGLAGTGAVVLGAADLASLTASGATIDTAGVTTTGAQSYTGATTLNGAYTGTGFIVTGATTLGGDTTVDGSTITLGSVNGAHNLGLAGTGAVVLGAANLASLTASGATIDTAGVITSGAQSYAGATTLNGAYTGTGFIVTGATTLGGDTTVDGSTITLGSVNGAHSLGLAGTGAVVLGAANLASLTASGATINTAGVITSGAQSYTGATTLNGAYTGTGFIVTGATTLGGDTTVDGSTITLGSVNGAHSLGLAGTGAVVLGAADLASLTASGATIDTAGVTTTGAQSYTGATTLNGAYTGTGFTVTGATTLGGGVNVTGTAVTLGTVDGAEALTINGGTGTVRVGALGSTTALASADISGGSLDINGARTTGAQTYTGAAITASGQYVTAGGAYTLAGSTTLDGATAVSTQGGTVTTGDVNGTVAGAQSLSVDAGTGSAALGALGSNVRLGAVLIRANTTVLNGATYAGNSLAFEGTGTNATVRLTRAMTTFNSTSGSTAGNIRISPNLIGTTAAAQSVAFIAGSGTGADSANGDVTLGNLGSDAIRLGAMSVTGSDLTAQTVKLAGDYSSVLSGNQTFSAQTLDTRGNANIRVAGNDAGPIIAGGSVTIVSGGTTTGSLTAGGPVNVTSTGNSNRVITSGGATTVVSQGTIGGSVVSSGPVILTATGPIVSSVTTPGAVSITSNGTVTVNVQASSLNLTAPGGTISGTFGTISTGAGGTFNVNGEVVVGDGTAADRQILVDNFLAPAGGVVGSTGQIQLPVNFALALIAPAGDGSGTARRPILVNSIDRLGELLRLGYTAIIVQIDGGEEYEQELDLAAEDTPQPQV